VRVIILSPPVLSRGLSDTLFEGGIESGIRIKADRESDIQYRPVLVIEISQQSFGMPNSVLV
jgi:hypothetical protein